MSPTEAIDERIRRIDECVFKLLELPVEDRNCVMFFVSTLQRKIDAALLEKRIAEKGSLQKFLEDDEDEDVIGPISSHEAGHRGAPRL